MLNYMLRDFLLGRRFHPYSSSPFLSYMILLSPPFYIAFIFKCDEFQDFIKNFKSYVLCPDFLLFFFLRFCRVFISE